MTGVSAQQAEVVSGDKPTSALNLAWQRIRRDPGALLAGFVILLFIFVAAFAPLLAPYDPTVPDRAVGFRTTPPSPEHLLGTDRAGRDVLSRLIYGARISLMVGFGSQLLSLSLGIVFGLLAGYFGGWTDTLISRFIEVLQAFPSLLFIIVLSVSIGPGLLTAYIALGIVGWASVARIVRGASLSLKSAEYVEGARALGASNGRLIFFHILPGILPSLIVIYTIGVGGAIIGEATLSFLGLGVRPPTPSWGQMIADGQSFLTSAWWMSVFPGLAIAIVVIAFNFLGDALRDALDPRMR
ncbi:MAG: ABC transporter permease [Deinococcota bacterium]|jgi:ABC-type dipeptide/oligopeptide/nickel transport system permease subunit|nr:ABC transporter permease [Deinococcota bacterium]